MLFSPSLASEQPETEVERLRFERDHLFQIACSHQLLPTILHELRNSVGAALTGLEVLIEEHAEQPIATDLHAVLSEVRRMRVAIEGIGSGTLALRATRTHAVDFACREAFRLVSPRALGGGLRALAEIADMPLLPIDPAAVRAIALNLLQNAILACRPGDSVTFRAAFDRDAKQFIMSVQDTGCGMSPRVLEHCCDLFFTSRKNGSGIGLALCSRLVSEAGGVLTIDSVEGRGTTVTLSIPAIEMP